MQKPNPRSQHHEHRHHHQHPQQRQATPKTAKEVIAANVQSLVDQLGQDIRMHLPPISTQ
jgi:hypothetical protein